jgi:hypothetical protein
MRKVLVCVFAASLFFTSCTRIGTSDLGLGLLPSLDGVAIKDTTLEVIAETVERLDSTIFNHSDIHILGEINNDPLFGKTQATMFFQMQPTYYPFYFAGSTDSLFVDSAVLVIKYKGYYGDSTKPLKIFTNIIDANTPLDPSRYYPTNFGDAFGFKYAESLADPKTLDFTTIGDSISNRFEADKNQIRIKLYDKYAKMFVKSFDTNYAYRNDTNFRASFPGFALRVDPSSNNNVLLKLAMTDTATRLALYIRSNTKTTAVNGSLMDTTVQYFKFLTYNNGNANFVKRTRTGAEIVNHLGKPNDSLVYLQSNPGTMVKIRIPGISNFPNKVIHQAVLQTEQVPNDAGLTSTETYYLPPKYLLLAAYDSINKVLRNVPNDYQSQNNTAQLAIFGGFLTTKSKLGYNNVASYNFNMTRYVQGVVSRKDSLFDFRIIAPVNDSLTFVPPYPNNHASITDYISNTGNTGNVPAIGRVRLGGGTNSRFKMKLHIYYSDL